MLNTLETSSVIAIVLLGSMASNLHEHGNDPGNQVYQHVILEKGHGILCDSSSQRLQPANSPQEAHVALHSWQPLAAAALFCP
jgi:hypothetical protein